MSESPHAEAEAHPEPAPIEKPKKKQDSFVVFLIKLVVIVVLFRTLLFTSFMIPSESMMPRLLVGDYLFAAKWPYGYSGASLPIDWNSGKGRIFGGLPERGDIVIFKHPIDRTDYVKRVIGLPGDQVQMIGGVLILNGEPVRKVRVADLVVPTTVSKGCREGDEYTRRLADGGFTCNYPQYRETLPSGVSYRVLDFGPSGRNMQYDVDADNTDPYVVAEGHLFVMGDNRDNSLDSRFPSMAAQGVGPLPVENVVGRASFMFFSTTSSWGEPSTWLSGVRWSRMGRGI